MNNSINLSLINLTLTEHNIGFVQLDAKDIYQNVCQQLNSYFIRTGLVLIILSILIHWFCWWFFNYGYKNLEIKKLYDRDTRIYWDMWIKARLMKLLIGYIVVVVYLSM